jgi:hypothetical protein
VLTTTLVLAEVHWQLPFRTGPRAATQVMMEMSRCQAALSFVERRADG